jgi:hypothetical protein
VTAPDPRLDEIQARLDAATPGPWKLFGTLAQWESEEDLSFGPDDAPEVGTVSEGLGDADFIANAPADVSYLLAELRKAREALGRVEEVAARLNWEADNANEGAKYAAEVNQGASLMALESERFAYQKAEHLIRAAVAAAKGDERG